MENETHEVKEKYSESDAVDYGKEGNDENEFKVNETISLDSADKVQIKEREYGVLWADELKSDISAELITMTKQEYFSLCRQSQKRLETCLSDEITDAYMDFSLLFKKFRLNYAHNLKLSNKVYELQSIKKLMENEIHNLNQELNKKDAKETELKTLYTSIRQAIAETVKQKVEIERERDELQQKLSQIPEEIVKAAGEYSLFTATEEKNKLKSQIEELEEKLSMMEDDLKNSNKREEIFREKYHEAKTLHAAYEEEIAAMKTEIMYLTQKKENAELLTAEKRLLIKQNLSTMERLKKDLAKLQEQLEKEKETQQRIFNEKITFKRAFHDSERTVRQLLNEHATRQFQITVLKARKKNLEDEAEKHKSEIHTLKVENAKVSKERNQFSWQVRILEGDLNKVKADFEEASHMARSLNSEKELLEKEKQHIENAHKEAINQMMMIDKDFQVAQTVIKNLQSEKKVVESKKELISKDLQSKVLQVEDLKNSITKNRSEKNNLAQNISDLNSKVARFQEHTKVLEQRCVEYEYKILQLQKDLQHEKEHYKLLNDIHKEISNQYRSTQQKLEDTKYLNSMVAQRNKDQIGQISNLEEKHDKLDKYIITLKVKNRKARSAQAQQEMRCQKLIEQLAQKEKEIMTAMKEVSEKETQLSLLKVELVNSTSERDALKLQLRQNNIDLKTKDEDIRLKQRDLLKTEQILSERNNDVRLLKTEIESLHRREVILKNQMSDVDKLRTEISTVHRQLLDEKLKNKRMEDEIQKPQNVHRWRLLEAEDPTKAHLIARNLKFRKDLVKKSEELASKEKELQDKVVEIAELQQNMKKIVEVQSVGNAWAIKKELQTCKERLKCLTAESSMFQSLTSALQNENERLKTENRKLKISVRNK